MPRNIKRRPRKALISTAAGPNSHLALVMEDTWDDISDLYDAVAPLGPTNLKPAQAQFMVFGRDGKFIVDITNPQDIAPSTINQRIAAVDPNPASRPIYHELQASPQVTFEDTSLILAYLEDTKTHYEFQNPNQTLFWRLRSRYQNGDPNDWQLFVDPSSCGVVSVASGALRSWAMNANANKNTSNNAVVTSIDIDATNTTVQVYGPGGVGTAWSRLQIGSDGSTVSTLGPYAAAAFTGKAYATTYYVAFNPATGQYLISTSYSDTLPDNYFWVGQVRTHDSNGVPGAGSPGGGGSAGGGEGGGGRGVLS